MPRVKVPPVQGRGARWPQRNRMTEARTLFAAHNIAARETLPLCLAARPCCSSNSNPPPPLLRCNPPPLLAGYARVCSTILLLLLFFRRCSASQPGPLATAAHLLLSSSSPLSRPSVKWARECTPRAERRSRSGWGGATRTGGTKPQTDWAGWSRRRRRFLIGDPENHRK